MREYGTKNGEALTEVQKELLKEIWDKYDIFSVFKEMKGLWRNNSDIPLFYNGKERTIDKRAVAYLFMLFIPTTILEKISSKDIVKLNDLRVNAIKGNVKNEKEFITLIQNYVNDVQPKAMIRHSTNPSQGKSYRERYCEYIKKLDNIEELLEYVMDGIDLLGVNDKDCSEIYNKSGKDYFDILDSIKKPFENNKTGSYREIVSNEINKFPQKTIAKYFICLQCGEYALDILDVLFPISDDIQCYDDFLRERLEGCIEQHDFRNIYKILSELDTNLLDDAYEINNKKSLELFCLGQLYRYGVDVDKDNKITKNKDKTKKAFINGIIQSDMEKEEYNNYVGEMLCWLYENYGDSLISQYKTDRHGDTSERILYNASIYGCERAKILLGCMYEKDNRIDEALDVYMSSCSGLSMSKGVKIIHDILEKEPDKYDKYIEYLKKAANHSVQKAIDIIFKYDKYEDGKKQVRNRNDYSEYYLIFGDNEENRLFMDSVPSDSVVFVFTENMYAVEEYKKRRELMELNRRLITLEEHFNIQSEKSEQSVRNDYIIYKSIGEIGDIFGEDGIYSLKKDKLLEILNCNFYIVAMGDDQQFNLKYITKFMEYCIYELKKSKNYLNPGEVDILVQFFTNHINIACNVNRKEGEIYLDRLQSMEEGMYIPMRITSYYEDASYELLWKKAPLFTINMNKESKNNKYIVITDTKDVLPIINNMLSVLGFGKTDLTYSLKVIGPVAEEIHSYMRIYESGLFSNLYKENDRLKELDFINVSLENHEIWEWDSKDSNNNAMLAIKEADYIVCAMKSSESNIRIAELIREKEIRILTKYNTPNYSSVCQIACLCDNNNMMENTLGFFINNDYIRYPWHNSFNIIGFGGKEQIYSKENLFDSFLDKLSYKVHEAYSRDSEGNVKEGTEQSYYSSLYSMDSSKINAVYTLYHMYTVGVFDNLRTWNPNYLTLNYQNIVNCFGIQIENNDVKEKLAEFQHNQWVRFMQTRGYKCASIDEVRNYIENGNPKHHSLKVLKLHPYMMAWQYLGDTNEQLQSKLMDVLSKEIEEMLNKLKEIKHFDVDKINESAVRKAISIKYDEKSLYESIWDLVGRKVDLYKALQVGCDRYRKEFIKKIADRVSEVFSEIISTCYINVNKNIEDVMQNIEKIELNMKEIIQNQNWINENKLFIDTANADSLFDSVIGSGYKELVNAVQSEVVIEMHKRLQGIFGYMMEDNVEKDIMQLQNVCESRNVSDEIVENFKQRYEEIKGNCDYFIVLNRMYQSDEEEQDINAQEKTMTKGSFEMIVSAYKRLFNEGNIMAKEVVFKTIYQMFECLLSERGNTVLSIYEKMYKIAVDLNQCNKGESTGLQLELDKLMKSMNEAPLGSLKDNDRRMIDYCFENYKILGREIGLYVSRDDVVKELGRER